MNRAYVAPLLVATGLLLGACGDDDSGGSATTAPAADSSAEAGDAAALCATLQDLFNATDEALGVDTEEASEEEIVEASARYFASPEAEALMEDALREAPPDLRDDLQTVIDAAREFGRTGDPAALDSDAVAAADEAVVAFEADNCPEPE